MPEMPETVSNTLKAMNARQSHACMHAVQQLLLMLPVTSMEAESTETGENQVPQHHGGGQAQCLLTAYLHNYITLDYDKIVDLYARRHCRRMSFLKTQSLTKMPQTHLTDWQYWYCHVYTYIISSCCANKCVLTVN